MYYLYDLFSTRKTISVENFVTSSKVFLKILIKKKKEAYQFCISLLPLAHFPILFDDEYINTYFVTFAFSFNSVFFCSSFLSFLTSEVTV